MWGEFSYRYYDGKGVLIRSNGDRYEGEFEYGDFDGEGVMTLAEPVDGVSEYGGVWKNGRLVESEHTQFVEDYRVDVEKSLYIENQLLEESLAKVMPGNADQTDMYFLGVAGGRYAARVQSGVIGDTGIISIARDWRQATRSV